MKKLILFTLLSVLYLVGFSQTFGRIIALSGTYDNKIVNGPDSFKLGWRTDRLQLKYNTDKRFIDFIKADSSVIIYNKLILESPNDTMLSVHGLSRFNNNVFIRDSIVFNDGTKQHTAWIPNVSDTGFVKTTGDSLYNNYRIFGGLRVGDVMTLGAIDSNYCIVHGLNSYSYAKWGASFNNSDNNAEYGFSANGGHQFGFRGASFNDGQNNQEDGFICNLGVNFYTNRQNSFACNKGSNYTSFGFAAGESFCNSWNAATFGYYNDTLSASKTNWVTTDPLFQIGNGTEWGTRNDAFRILKNGKTYIGDSSSTTDAILIVDPTDSTVTQLGMVKRTYVQTVNDDANLILPDDFAGWVEVSALNSGTEDEYASFRINSDGTIAGLTFNTANVTLVLGTDGNLNIGTSSTKGVIENKLGGARDFIVRIEGRLYTGM